MNDLKNLSDRLEKFKNKKDSDKDNIEKKSSINYSIAVNISIELITGIALGVFFGLVIDNYLQTKPCIDVILNFKIKGKDTFKIQPENYRVV